MPLTADAGEVGWRLVRIADLLRRCERGAGQALEQLDDAAAGEGTAIVLARGRIVELGATGHELAELADQLRALTDGLPAADVAVAWGDVTAAVAVALEDGIADPEQALLAARQLPFKRGWRALATALTASDAHLTWGELRAGTLLASFRGADPALARRVCDAAGLSDDARLSACEGHDVARLVAALVQVTQAPGR